MQQTTAHFYGSMGWETIEKAWYHPKIDFYTMLLLSTAALIRQTLHAHEGMRRDVKVWLLINTAHTGTGGETTGKRGVT